MVFLLPLFIITIIYGLSLDNMAYMPKLSLNSVYHSLALVKIDENSATKLLKPVNIVMAGQEEEVILASNYINQAPEKFLLANLGAIEKNQVSRSYNPTHGEVKLPAILQGEEDITPVNLSAYDFNQDYTVAFYCTHNGETFIPNSQKARLDGERALVTDVTQHLAKEIKKRGLNTEYNDTMHDYPEYNKSYSNSRVTVNEIVKNKDVIALFDVHRDSIPGNKNAYTINIKGKESARILIIVGTDERKPHPNWQENLAFAEKLRDKGEELYPGLIKGVRTKAGTYNQEFHPRALLLEIGIDQNSLAEAKYAGELMAEIIVEVIKEEVD